MADTPGVVISWMFDEETSGWFTKALADVLLYDNWQGKGYMSDPKLSGLISLSTGPRIAEARNSLVDLFARDFPNSEWLLMIDSDMTFGPDLLDCLLANADPIEAPIVGGLCFAGGKRNAPYPTVYRQVLKNEGTPKQYVTIERVYDYPRNVMLRVGATGGACLLMHRKALAAMEGHFGKRPDGKPNPYPWFAEGVVGPDGEPWGEDILFCLRANQLGIPVWVHTGVKLGHVKSHIIDETYYDNHRRSVELTEQGHYDVRQPADQVGSPGRQAAELEDASPNGVKPNRAARRAAARARVSA
jgi:hypothetical protein